MVLKERIIRARKFIKAPPGLPPRPGLKWKDETSRWIRPSVDSASSGDSERTNRLVDSNYDDSLVSVSGKRGSQPGGVYRNSQTGKRAYVKFVGATRAKTETLAAALYGVAGVNVPKVSTITFKGEVAVKSDWLEGIKSMSIKEMKNNRAVREGFVVDAWLANWDVVGTGADNIGNVDGVTYRIDAGGSLLFRAQGGPKKFDERVPELKTMRDPNISWEGSKVFGTITEAELQIGAQKVINVSDSQIETLVKESGLPIGPIKEYPGPDNISQFLIDQLKARRNTIQRRFGKVEKALKLSIIQLVKAPPGPPPRSGLKWRETTHRWIKPEDQAFVEQLSNKSVNQLVVGLQRLATKERELLGQIKQIKERADAAIKRGSMQGAWEEFKRLRAQGKPLREKVEQINQLQNEARRVLANKQGKSLMETAGLEFDFTAERIWELDELAGQFIAEDAPSYVNESNSMALGKYLDIGYGAMNLYVTTKGKLNVEWREFVEELKDLMVPLDQPQLVFRGIRDQLVNEQDEFVSEGDELILDKFSSTSRKVSTAYGFLIPSFTASSRESTLIEIQTTSKTRGITTSNNDTGRVEDETILDYGQRVKVKSVRRNVPRSMFNKNDSGLMNYIVVQVVDEESA